MFGSGGGGGGGGIGEVGPFLFELPEISMLLKRCRTVGDGGGGNELALLFENRVDCEGEPNSACGRGGGEAAVLCSKQN